MKCQYCKRDVVDANDPFTGTVGDDYVVCNDCDLDYVEFRDDALARGLSIQSAHKEAISILTIEEGV